MAQIQYSPYQIALLPKSEPTMTAGAAERATRLALCAEAFRVIDANLEAFSPGRVAAVGVRGGLAEGEGGFLNIHVHTTRATHQRDFGLRSPHSGLSGVCSSGASLSGLSGVCHVHIIFFFSPGQLLVAYTQLCEEFTGVRFFPTTCTE